MSTASLSDAESVHHDHKQTTDLHCEIKATILTALSKELIQFVLSKVSDALDLKSVLCSHSGFYGCYKLIERDILMRVLKNQIDATVLPDALTAMAVRLLPSQELMHCQREIEDEDILGRMHANPFQILDAWTLNRGLVMSRTHQAVQFFAQEYAASALNHPLFPKLELSPRCFSHSEMYRVENALYRIETFRSFPEEYKESRAVAADLMQREGFFSAKFPCWEMEQIASAYEHLLSRSAVSAAFDDVAEHDLRWGEHCVPYLGHEYGAPNLYQGHCLSLGLLHLEELALAKKFGERHSLLNDHLEEKRDFMASMLFNHVDESMDGIRLCDLSEEARQKFLGNSSFNNDQDSCPRSAWIWAYADVDLATPYGTFRAWELRQSGLFFLDIDRLLELDTLDNPFVDDFRLNAKDEW